MRRESFLDMLREDRGDAPLGWYAVRLAGETLTVLLLIAAVMAVYVVIAASVNAL